MYYTLSEKEAIIRLSSKESGLSEKEAQKRLEKYGLNELKRTKYLSKLKIFLSQFKSYIIYILIVAALISFLLKEYTDGIIITTILILNSVLGFIQEYKAEKSLEALKRLTTPKAIVLRNNNQKEIEAKFLVPGDIIILSEGANIPADARILSSFSLKLNESTLTGESISVEKTAEKLPKNLILQKQRNMVFMGTSVVLGHAIAIVTATNMETELGKIAEEVQNIKDTLTPLQKKLKDLGKYITISILFICLFILIVGYFFLNYSFFTIFMTTMALIVAAIPEGLPAIVTISLAIGTQKMIKKNILIRKLYAVETLGSTTLICTDKTGTLTKNEMTVTEIYANNRVLKPSEANIEILLRIAKLCNNYISDPTEKALISFIKQFNYNKDYKRINEVPFSSEKKYMSTINLINNKEIIHIKGAPEFILKNSKKILINNKIKDLDNKTKQEIFKNYNRMANNALRVLALAYSTTTEKELIFVGLIGMIDPPRKEVKDAISLCKKAGIRIIMLTGDYELTAKAIAKEVGIIGDSLNGDEIDRLSRKELIKKLKTTNIIARVSPKHKREILELLQEQGEIVAMTGDGVNDATSLKKADIGAAVGSGTDVAKQSSDIIILDNNFSSIVEAVKEGRTIYTNIKKFILFLFSCNLGEVLVIFLSLILGLPLPLIAIQILWVNLLTDGLPAIALGMDKAPSSIMNIPPRNPKEPIINNKNLLRIIIQSSILTIGVLFIFTYFRKYSLIYAQTAAFSCLVLFQLFNAFNYTTIEKFKDFFENKYLLMTIAISFLLQLVVVYLLSNLFKTTPLFISHWFLIIMISSMVFILDKVIFNKYMIGDIS
ncbi:calcium-translocating P-type ATPase, PMCA-type [Candidatus Woesearchaeota archaeon]|nr:calcium-translocating P-type ATPase, PMCA-type [Candidatus Woesearchaeota archaeon]